MFWLNRIMDGEFSTELLDKNIPEEMRIPMMLAGLVRTFFDKSYFEEFGKAPKTDILKLYRSHISEISNESLQNNILTFIEKLDENTRNIKICGVDN